MNATQGFLTLLAASCLCFPGPPDDEPSPEPRFDRIDYNRPQDYLALNKSSGDPEHIRTLAAALKTDSPERTLIAIGRWINSKLTCDNRAAYSWRDFDQVIGSKVYGGCADHALVFGSLSRACGIPTVWVKTMDADWIREYRMKWTCTSWRGHVFLEVHLGNRWRLLDASGLLLYDDYDPAMRILPGNRYAYDKGGDPKELILSTDWERWKRQTANYFTHFDLGKLPVGEGRPLGAVYVAADSPVWQAVGKRMKAFGYSTFSFNTNFDRFLDLAKGGDLIITCVGDRPVLPGPYHTKYLPDEIRAKMKQDPKGVIRKRLEDGTRLLLVYGKDVDAVLKVVEGLELESGR
jgi:Transglutaminase-like superfamily